MDKMDIYADYFALPEFLDVSFPLRINQNYHQESCYSLKKLCSHLRIVNIFASHRNNLNIFAMMTLKEILNSVQALITLWTTTF